MPIKMMAKLWLISIVSFDPTNGGWVPRPTRCAAHANDLESGLYTSWYLYNSFQLSAT